MAKTKRFNRAAETRCADKSEILCLLEGIDRQTTNSDAATRESNIKRWTLRVREILAAMK